MLPARPDTNRQFVCYVALGSNLGDSHDYILRGAEQLASHPEVRRFELSPLYCSKPVGPQNQPDYVNAAVRFETSLSADDLLDVLQAIENKHNRVREGVVRWGPRTLDLDLLLYGSEFISTQRLTVPHPQLCKRVFVLLPLADLQPDLKMPGGETIEHCIRRLSAQDKASIRLLE